jgi:DivIVA domain-containing protein
VSTFPKVPKGKLGYAINEVDLLISRARDQYSNVSTSALDWRELTAHGFTLVKGGYQPEAVDAAIDKLQDTFASKDSSSNQPTQLRILLLGRVSRPKGRRFSRAGVMRLGYSRSQVDAVIKVIEEYLEGGEKLLIDEIRKMRFKVQRGGYIESQVDSYIDRLVEHIQTERFVKPITAPIVGSSYGFPSYPDPTDPGFKAY